MRIITTALVVLLTLSVQAQNLLKDGGFENQKVYENNQVARIASFGDLGKSTQITNPKLNATQDVEEGIWYKRAGNTGYIRATVTNSDYAEGEKSILLSVNKNSPQKNLDKWQSTTLLQFCKLEGDKSYELTFKVKNNVDCGKVFVGAVTGNGSIIDGSTWVEIGDAWKEYTITVNPKNHKASKGYSKRLMSKAAIVFGIESEYDSNNRSKQVSLLIDDVKLQIK